MKVDIQDVNSCKKTLIIEIPKEDVKAEIEKTYDEVRKEAVVPGFRKGRAPRHILKMRFGEYIKGDVIENLVIPATQEAIEDADLDLLRALDASDIEPPLSEINVSEDESIQFQITVDVKPEINLPDISLLEVDKSEVNVTQEEANEYLERLRAERSNYIPIEDRPIQSGDFVTINLSAKINDEPVDELTLEENVVEISDSIIIPEISDNLIGMNQEEKKDFSISLPGDFKSDEEESWFHKNLAGKTVDFHAEIVKITERQLPELNDDFAKDMDEEDIDHLKAKIWNQLVEMRQQSKKNEQENELVEQLIEKCQFDIPEFLIEQQSDVMLRINNIQSNTPNAEPTEEDIAKSRELATSVIKRNWIFEEIASQEDITVTDEDLDAEIQVQAQQRGRDPKLHRKMLEDANRLDSMRSTIIDNKIVDFLVDTATAKRKLII